MNTAIDFLQQLRPAPWVLTAIAPDGPATTITAQNADEARDFIIKHNGHRNLYYSVNPLREAVTKKAKKTEVAAIEFLLGDLDPNDDETPEQAKERYLKALEKEPEASALIDSGNGVQGLWRLETPIVLPPLADGKLCPEADAIIADVEGRAKALMERLGAKAGTQNIDRILRLPGTINLPNKKKLETGRVPCEARLLRANGVVHPLNVFPPPAAADARAEGNQPRTPDDGGHHAQQQESDDEDELWRTIRDGGEKRHGATRSEAQWWVVNEMLRRGYAPAAIVKVLLDRSNRVSDHTHDQGKPREYAERQVAEAKKKITLVVDDKGIPYKSPTNIRIALIRMGITLRHDKFADRVLIDGLADFGPMLEDAAVDRIWLLMEQRLRFRPSKELVRTVIEDAARLNGFHPVRDYLDGLRWDATERIDRWLTTYGEAEDSEYTRAVGALMLVAAVRRVRQPGCKFDEMLVIENPEQGTDKSTALRVLAVREEWFSDDMPLNIEGKRVIECLRGRWIAEAAELSGMRRADIEHVKAQLSRQVDRARLAYGHIVSEVPRQCVFFGTTNSVEFLRDTSGNRRFWPVHVGRFDVAALSRDCDQLWAEAAAREATEVSIRLPPALWPAAAEEQAKRLTADPYFEALQNELGDMQGKISSESVWEILDVKAGHRGQDQSRRIADAMRALGWRRPNKGNVVKIGGRAVVGFVKGEQPWAEVTVRRTWERELTVQQAQAEMAQA